jgi:hypothetical protein
MFPKREQWYVFALYFHPVCRRREGGEGEKMEEKEWSMLMYQSFTFRLWRIWTERQGEEGSKDGGNDVDRKR